MDSPDVQLLSQLYPELSSNKIVKILELSGQRKHRGDIIEISSESDESENESDDDVASEISDAELDDLGVFEEEKSPSNGHGQINVESIQSIDKRKQPSLKDRKLVSLENFNSDLFSADFSDSDEDQNDSNPREKAVLPPISHAVTEKPQKSRQLTDRTAASLVFPIFRCHSDTQVCGDEEFLKSLSPHIPDYRRHPDADVYVKQFKKNRLDLVQRLYALFNRKVFDAKLPTDFQITWNARLTKTAGLCYYKTVTNDKIPVRVARIELSEKVCDTAERVRDTLLHEICHVAVWLINGVRGSHGPVWKLWARKANRTFADLPPVRRCHSYEIHAKFIYRCQKCSQEIKRHSKSLDVEKKVCGLCQGRFELLVTTGKQQNSALKTPAPLNRFAAFVQQNYSEVKSTSKLSSHKDVMAKLSKDFASLKTHLEF